MHLFIQYNNLAPFKILWVSHKVLEDVSAAAVKRWPGRELRRHWLPAPMSSCRRPPQSNYPCLGSDLRRASTDAHKRTTTLAMIKNVTCIRKEERKEVAASVQASFLWDKNFYLIKSKCYSYTGTVLHNTYIYTPSQKLHDLKQCFFFIFSTFYAVDTYWWHHKYEQDTYNYVAKKKTLLVNTT